MSAQPQTKINGSDTVPQCALYRAYIVGHFLATDAMRAYLGLPRSSSYPPGYNATHLRHFFHPDVIASRKAGFADACAQMRAHTLALQRTDANQPDTEASHAQHI